MQSVNNNDPNHSFYINIQKDSFDQSQLKDNISKTVLKINSSYTRMNAVLDKLEISMESLKDFYEQIKSKFIEDKQSLTKLQGKDNDDANVQANLNANNNNNEKLETMLKCIQCFEKCLTLFNSNFVILEKNLDKKCVLGSKCSVEKSNEIRLIVENFKRTKGYTIENEQIQYNDEYIPNINALIQCMNSLRDEIQIVANFIRLLKKSNDYIKTLIQVFQAIACCSNDHSNKDLIEFYKKNLEFYQSEIAKKTWNKNGNEAENENENEAENENGNEAENENGNEANDMNKFIEKNISSYLEDINKILLDYSQDSKDNIDLLKSLEFHEYYKRPSDFCWLALQDIYKNNLFLETPAIMSILNKMLSFYKEHVFNNHVTEKLIESSKVFNKDYLAIDYLYQNTMDELINQNIYDAFLKNHVFDNEELSCKDQLANNYVDIGANESILGESFFSVSFVISQDYNFFMKIQYKDGIQEKAVKKEKNIFRRRDERQNNIFRNKDDAKFIVKLYDENSKTAIIPLFPLGKLTYALENKNIDKCPKINLTIVDKIVIILEIAEALKGLHANDLFHGNLWDSSVYLNAKKDAYLSYFCYERSEESNQTKSQGPLYYRPPESIRSNDDELGKSSDIFAFGVLIHSLLTETKPIDRTSNTSREFRFSLVNSSEYRNFLFSGFNNECFEDDSINGFKNIIMKCMEKKPNDRFTEMDEIINSIKDLKIFKENDTEIYYRIRNAVHANDYKCTLADILKSYYRGQTYAFQFVKEEFTEKDIGENDIINYIYEKSGVKPESPHLDFANFFDLAIYNHLKQVKNEIRKNLVIDNSFDELSSSVINQSNYTNIFPICSLNSFKPFINSDQNKAILWGYLMAREINNIHSADKYICDLSLDSFGIFYNSITRDFVPSFIAYYYFNKKRHSFPDFPSCLSDDEKYEKYVKKDIKKFKKILKEINVPEDIINEIDKKISMNSIVFCLYNRYLKRATPDQKNIFDQKYKKIDYSAYNIDYSSLCEIIEYFKANLDKFKSEMSLILDIKNIFSEISMFLSNTISSIDSPIEDNLPLVTIDPNPTLNSDNIDQIFIYYEEIKSKSLDFYSKIKDQIIIFKNEENEIDEYSGLNKNQKTKFVNFETIKREKKKPTEISSRKNRRIERILEITELCMISFTFLLRRYLFHLNPYARYLITIRIINRMMYKMRQDVKIKADDVVNVCEQINDNSIVATKKDNGDIDITVKRKYIYNFE